MKLLDFSEQCPAQFSRRRHLQHLVSLRWKAFHFGYIFEAVRRVFWWWIWCDCWRSDLSLTKVLFCLYTHLQGAVILGVYWKTSVFPLFNQRKFWFNQFWFALNSDMMTLFDFARHICLWICDLYKYDGLRYSSLEFNTKAKTEPWGTRWRKWYLCAVSSGLNLFPEFGVQIVWVGRKLEASFWVGGDLLQCWVWERIPLLGCWALGGTLVVVRMMTYSLLSGSSVFHGQSLSQALAVQYQSSVWHTNFW